MAALESKGRHRVFAQVVEFALVVLLIGVGTVSVYFAVHVDQSIRWGSAGGLVLVAALSSWLGWRRSLDLKDFNHIQEKGKK